MSLQLSSFDRASRSLAKIGSEIVLLGSPGALLVALGRKGSLFFVLFAHSASAQSNKKNAQPIKATGEEANDWLSVRILWLSSPETLV